MNSRQDCTGQTLYTTFRTTAERWPDTVALEVGPEQLSYAELLSLADRVAGQLVGAHERPRAVGLLALRTPAAYAGYLAALRLGATVVPLHPSFPPARSEVACRLADVDLVVVDDVGLPAAMAMATRPAVIALTQDQPGGWRAGLTAEPWSEPYDGTPGDIAYCLFTSGSTGTPKAVPIRHANLTGYLDDCVARYDVRPGCRLSQTFDLTFDPSVFDMFVAWAGGATLIVPSLDDVLSPVRFVNELGITHWFSVPSVVSVARRFRTLQPGCMRGLRWSLFAGEQLTLEQARCWSTAAPNSVLENLYGPTELTISCTRYRLARDPEHWPRTSNGTVPIGRPYPHLETVVLNERGTAAQEGELCVRGPQRFDGYLNSADDRDRFVRYDGGIANPASRPSRAIA